MHLELLDRNCKCYMNSETQYFCRHAHIHCTCSDLWTDQVVSQVGQQVEIKQKLNSHNDTRYGPILVSVSAVSAYGHFLYSLHRGVGISALFYSIGIIGIGKGQQRCIGPSLNDTTYKAYIILLIFATHMGILVAACETCS